MTRLLALALLAALAGCPPPEPQGPPRLEGAVHEIPVFPRGRVDSALDGESLDGQGRFSVWFVETGAPLEEVVAFYDEALSQAEREVQPDDSVSYVYRPVGADGLERIEVHVRPGEVEIVERVAADAAPLEEEGRR